MYIETREGAGATRTTLLRLLTRDEPREQRTTRKNLELVQTICGDAAIEPAIGHANGSGAAEVCSC